MPPMNAMNPRLDPSQSRRVRPTEMMYPKKNFDDHWDFRPVRGTWCANGVSKFNANDRREPVDPVGTGQELVRGPKT